LYSMMMKRVLILIALTFCFCSPQTPEPRTYFVEDVGSFEYNGKTCVVKGVRDSEMNERGWDLIRFIDCGDGPICGQYPAGKFGLH